MTLKEEKKISNGRERKKEEKNLFKAYERNTDITDPSLTEK